MTWITHPGYNETHQLVDEQQRVVGSANGSIFQKENAWAAYDERSRPPVWLGRYTTLDAAKAAVERAML